VPRRSRRDRLGTSGRAAETWRGLDNALVAAKQRKAVPHQFVLDAIAALLPTTRPMFGCLAVYVADKIVLILRDKRDATAGDGVWLATTEEHHDSLRREFPNMRSIHVLGEGVTGWQVLPVDAADFEEAALRAQHRPGHAEQLVRQRDHRHILVSTGHQL
jgi:hypothetical protein